MNTVVEYELESEQLVQKMHEVFMSDRPIVGLELNSVFALMAPANLLGMKALDESKQRLPGKFYGLGFFDENAIQEVFKEDVLPNVFKAIHDQLHVIFRLPVKPIYFDSPIVSDGFLQIFLGDQTVKKVIRRIINQISIDDMSYLPPAELQGVLITSMNVSGSKSITSYSEAYNFCAANNVPILIQTDLLNSKVGMGSYTIVKNDGTHSTIVREGFNVNEVKMKLNI